MADEISNDKARFALEVWKTAIEVQKHFNTIEMQIRNIAVTVLTATIGAAALVYNQAQETAAEAARVGASVPPINSIKVFGLSLSSADMIIVGGLVAWLAFYFMDRWWYHRLLQGAVSHAQYVENELKKDIPYADLLGLSNAIREASPIRPRGRVKIRSNTKIDIFYGAVLVVLIAMVALVF